jgi:hypothetical protein
VKSASKSHDQMRLPTATGKIMIRSLALVNVRTCYLEYHKHRWQRHLETAGGAPRGFTAISKHTRLLKVFSALVWNEWTSGNIIYAMGIVYFDASFIWYLRLQRMGRNILDNVNIQWKHNLICIDQLRGKGINLWKLKLSIRMHLASFRTECGRVLFKMNERDHFNFICIPSVMQQRQTFLKIH